MKKIFKKIHNQAIELADVVAKDNHKDMSEEDLDTLAEAIEILNDMYETLYDRVFVEVEEE